MSTPPRLRGTGSGRRLLRGITRAVASRTPLDRYLHPRYSYMFTPGQLCRLCGLLDGVAQVPGNVVEVGCAYGQTTIFLKKHLETSANDRDYYCLDTFSGFVDRDVEHERLVRGKNHPYDWFDRNSLDWFQRTMELNSLARVNPIRADAVHFDYRQLGPVAFCLVDVDLYLPVKAALDGILPVMSPGSVIVVDDCMAGSIFDGALQAFEEFTTAHQLKGRILEDKLGVIEVPA